MASSAASATLAAASSVGAGTTIDFVRARSRVTAVVVPSGTITGGLVTLEGSQDNTNWVNVYVFSPLTGRNEYYATTGGTSFRYWRCSVATAITGGGAVRATLMYADTEDSAL